MFVEARADGLLAKLRCFQASLDDLLVGGIDDNDIIEYTPEKGLKDQSRFDGYNFAPNRPGVYQTKWLASVEVQS